MHKSLCLLAFCLLCSLLTDGQILNADRFGVKVDSSKRFAGNVQLNFNFTQQQSTVTQFGTIADLSYLIGKSLFIISNRHTILRVDQGSVLNVGFTHLRYRYRMSEVWVPELFAQVQVEALRGLSRRWLAGANLKMKITDQEKLGLAVGLGLMFEQEDWTDKDVRDGETVPYDDNWCFEAPCQTNLVKVNQYLSLRWQIEKSVSFDLTNYIQFVPDRFAVYPRIATDASFTFKIGKYIRYRISYNGGYDSRPPVPTRLLYYQVSQGLGFTF